VRTIGRISPDPITELPQVGGGSTGGECKASETRPAGPQGPRSMPDDLVRLLLALTTDPRPPVPAGLPVAANRRLGRLSAASAHRTR
jgi:hypothetical protein